MKKIALSLIALAAISGAALAERNYDLRDADTYMGKFSNEAASTEKLSVPAIEWQLFYGSGGTSTDAMEVRRWDEQNG